MNGMLASKCEGTSHLRLVLLSATSLLLGSAALNSEEATTVASRPFVQADSPIDAGRYLIVVSGCNDCHTAGYMDKGGNVPESDWLTGSPLGWRGPWGTTYASNLRLLAQSISEDAWVAYLHTRTERPPMPWMNTNKLSDRDARAIYQYIRALGPKGESMPAGLAPDVEPLTPFVLMVPAQPAARPSVAKGETGKQTQ